MVLPANGSEGEAWMEAWCTTCIRDIAEDCPILMRALTDEDPPEWHRGPPWSPQTVIFCIEYKRRPHQSVLR